VSKPIHEAMVALTCVGERNGRKNSENQGEAIKKTLVHV